jgi:hypothetical protein
VPPKLFARKRSALVDQIRRAGDEETAKIVKARRTPTIPVWVVNRLALAHPKTVDELIEAADRVKAIQLGRRQEASGLAKAMAVYRAVLDRILDHSRPLLKEAGTGNTHQMLFSAPPQRLARADRPSALPSIQPRTAGPAPSAKSTGGRTAVPSS